MIQSRAGPTPSGDASKNEPSVMIATDLGLKVIVLTSDGFF